MLFGILSIYKITSVRLTFTDILRLPLPATPWYPPSLHTCYLWKHIVQIFYSVVVVDCKCSWDFLERWWNLRLWIGKKTIFGNLFFFFFFWARLTACRILVPWPGMEPRPISESAKSIPNSFTTLIL